MTEDNSPIIPLQFFMVCRFGNLVSTIIANLEADFHEWRLIERPFLSIISRMIQAKTYFAEEIIGSEKAAPPIILVVFSSVYVLSSYYISSHRYARLPL